MTPSYNTNINTNFLGATLFSTNFISTAFFGTHFSALVFFSAEIALNMPHYQPSNNSTLRFSRTSRAELMHFHDAIIV